jgi:RNA polymerase sigma-70 factor, ECF subfamily
VTVPSPTDEELIERIRRGDTEAFRGLVEKYQASVWRLIRNLVPSHVPVEDLAQDVFLTAFTQLHRYDATRGRFSSWLLTIAKNHALNAKKKRYATAVAEPPELATNSTPADDAICGQLQEQLELAFRRLPDALRTTFVLGEILGLTTEQIVEIEGGTPSTIRSRLSRAKAALLAAILAPKDMP